MPRRRRGERVGVLHPARPQPRGDLARRDGAERERLQAGLDRLVKDRRSRRDDQQDRVLRGLLERLQQRVLAELVQLRSIVHDDHASPAFERAQREVLLHRAHLLDRDVLERRVT